MHNNTIAPVPDLSHETEKQVLKGFPVFTTQGCYWASRCLPLLSIFFPHSHTKKAAARFCMLVSVCLLPGLAVVVPILSWKYILAPNRQ